MENRSLLKRCPAFAASDGIMAVGHRPLASGWPMVPLMEDTPPVLVPPPPSIVNQSIE